MANNWGLLIAMLFVHPQQRLLRKLLPDAATFEIIITGSLLTGLEAVLLHWLIK